MALYFIISEIRAIIHCYSSLENLPFIIFSLYYATYLVYTLPVPVPVRRINPSLGRSDVRIGRPDRRISDVLCIGCARLVAARRKRNEVHFFKAQCTCTYPRS